jgi:uncharacterized protein (TIGR02271 family)
MNNKNKKGSKKMSDAQALTSTTAATTDATDIVVPAYEEELTVGKRQEQIGEVHLRKEVVQEQETVPVNLRHEEVTVERVAVSGQAVDPAALRDAFQGEDITVPVMGEEAVVGTQTREVEEVRLHKGATQEQQQVTGTVRKERVTVDATPQELSTGDVAPRGQQPRRPRQS